MVIVIVIAMILVVVIVLIIVMVMVTLDMLLANSNSNSNSKINCNITINTLKIRKSEMANTSPATCQCLATFTPLKSKMLIFFRDVISLLARVVIFLIDRATQEVPMRNI